MEILITLIIVALAGFILFKNVKSSAKGECNCSSNSSCSATHCPKYDSKIDTITIKKGR
ncbi:FeoB-associated Cys-rich membrane protein [Clostridium sp. YIM B02505]|uniref:FeoB-associated Cys-rich membrane protein n=1 Tax=Clostridium yunnanense TaxID=2800325 RepID=A0ABS1EWJ5_9CLOT|nr:FeoB-associated Cys-rich membrane protein [Clostridium yunnanense]MBK1813680.1 FeoB-associated Cys-rich membrane protein [Clostridium yunnanense]